MSTPRIMKEMNQLQKEPISNCSAGPVGNNLTEWQATIFGPEDSPFEGGIFYLDIEFLIRNPDNSIKINPKAKKLLVSEMEMTKDILKNEFSGDFINFISHIIKYLGKMNSRELEEYERKKGFTSKQYGRIL